MAANTPEHPLFQRALKKLGPNPTPAMVQALRQYLAGQEQRQAVAEKARNNPPPKNTGPGNLQGVISGTTPAPLPEAQPMVQPAQPLPGLPEGYTGGAFGPAGEPLPSGAEFFDKYGNPYFKTTDDTSIIGDIRNSLGNYFQNIKYRWNKEVKDQVDVTVGVDTEKLKEDTVKTAWLGQFGAAVSLFKNLPQYTQLFTNTAHNIENLPFGLHVVGRAVSEAVRAGVAAFSAPAVWVERGAGTVAGVAEGKELDDAYQSSRVFYSSLFHNAANEEFIRRYRAGENPYSLAMELEDPLVEAVGQMIDPTLLLSIWGKAASIGKVDDLVKAGMAVDDLSDIGKALNTANKAENAVDAARDLARAVAPAVDEADNFMTDLATKVGITAPTGGAKAANISLVVHDTLGLVVRNTPIEQVQEVLTAMVTLVNKGADEASHIWAAGIVAKNPAARTILSKGGLKSASVMADWLVDDAGGIAKTRLGMIEKMIAEAKASDAPAAKLAELLTKKMEVQAAASFPTIQKWIKGTEEIQTLVRNGESIPRHLARFVRNGKVIEVPENMKRLANLEAVLDKTVGPINRMFAALYMGMNPAYPVRNWITNTVHMLVDEPGSVFTSWKKELEFMKGYGVLNAESEVAFTTTAMASDVGEVGGGLKKWFTWGTKWAGVLEERAGIRVSGVAIRKALRRMLPKMFADVGDANPTTLLRQAGFTDVEIKNFQELLWANKMDVRATVQKWVAGNKYVRRNLSGLGNQLIHDLEGSHMLDELTDAFRSSDDVEDFLRRTDQLFEERKRLAELARAEEAILEADDPFAAEWARIEKATADGEDITRSRNDLLARRMLFSRQTANKYEIALVQMISDAKRAAATPQEGAFYDNILRSTLDRVQALGGQEAAESAKLIDETLAAVDKARGKKFYSRVRAIWDEYLKIGGKRDQLHVKFRDQRFEAYDRALDSIKGVDNTLYRQAKQMAEENRLWDNVDEQRFLRERKCYVRADAGASLNAADKEAIEAFDRMEGVAVYAEGTPEAQGAILKQRALAKIDADHEKIAETTLRKTDELVRVKLSRLKNDLKIKKGKLRQLKDELADLKKRGYKQGPKLQPVQEQITRQEDIVAQAQRTYDDVLKESMAGEHGATYQQALQDAEEKYLRDREYVESADPVSLIEGTSPEEKAYNARLKALANARDSESVEAFLFRHATLDELRVLYGQDVSRMRQLEAVFLDGNTDALPKELMGDLQKWLFQRIDEAKENYQRQRTWLVDPGSEQSVLDTLDEGGNLFVDELPGNDMPDWLRELTTGTGKSSKQTILNTLRRMTEGNLKDRKGKALVRRMLKDYWGFLQNEMKLSDPDRYIRVMHATGNDGEIIRMIDEYKVLYGEDLMETILQNGSADTMSEVIAILDPLMSTRRPYFDDVMARDLRNQIFGRVGSQGAGTPLHPPMTGGTPTEARAALEAEDGMETMRQRITDKAADLFAAEDQVRLRMTPEQESNLTQAVKILEQRAVEAKGAAMAVGNEARKFTLLDYRDRREMDMVVGYGMPFQFWYSRTYANWLKRTVMNQYVIAAYARYRTALEKQHAGMPSWWKYNVNTNELLGLDSENPLYFNLEAALNPLNGLLGVDFNDPDRQKTWWTKTVDNLGKFGPTVWSPVTMATGIGLYIQGDKDAAEGFLGRTIPLTQTIKSVSLMAGIKGNQGLLTPGGLELDPTVLLLSGGMTKYERNRIGRAMADLMASGKYTEAELIDAAYDQKGAVWEEAATLAAQKRALGTAIGGIAGVGFKGRNATDALIDQMYTEMGALSQRAPDLSPEEYRRMWSSMRQKYPFMDTVLLSRRSTDERDTALSYNVMSRVPPSQMDDFAKIVGLDKRLLEKFYQSKGKLNTWEETDRMRFMSAVRDLGFVLEVPATTTRHNWEEAQFRYSAVTKLAKQQFGEDILDRVDTYYSLKDDRTKAERYLQQDPDVSQYLDWRAEMVLNDDILNKYYGGIDFLEGYVRSRMYREAREKFGEDVTSLSSIYYDIKDEGGDTQRFVKDHPQLKEYWDWKAEYEKKITSVLSDAGKLFPEKATAIARPDAKLQSLGAQDVLAGLQDEAATSDPEHDAMVAAYSRTVSDSSSSESFSLTGYIEDEAEKKWPGITPLWEQYQAAAASNTDIAKQLWKKYPQLSQYKKWSDAVRKQYNSAVKGQFVNRTGGTNVPWAQVLGPQLYRLVTDTENGHQLTAAARQSLEELMPGMDADAIVALILAQS